MGSYRGAYPSGAASASAAYRCAGDTHEGSLLSFSSQGDGELRSNPLGIRGRASVYSTLYGLTGGLQHHPHGRSFLTQNEDIGGVAVYTEAESHGVLRGSELLTRPYLRDFHGSNVGMSASHGRTLYTGSSSFNLLSAETDLCAYGHISDTFVNSTYKKQQVERTPADTDLCAYGHISDTFVNSTYNKQQVERTPHTTLQTPVKKRKTPSLDEIIRETWELHSLFRAGLAGSSDPTESCTDDIIASEKWGKPSQVSTVGYSERDWADKSLQNKPVFDKTWCVDSSGLFDTTSSWKELDVPTKERKGAPLNKKPKEALPQLDTEQEQHSSDLQRLICERVAEFMGNYSDGDSSDNDSFMDSDDDVPNVIADSSSDVKSREEQAFEFFLQAFVESKELQKLYSEQCHVGKFDCLVCSSIPGKPAKKYNGLISVIMHASKIIKTKRRQEHRGYARALCSAMGWDLYKLPTTPCSSSPHPRCCIPTNEDEGMDAKKIGEVMTARTQKEV